MALKQIEDAYNAASELERAERWPSTPLEKEYSRLRKELQQKKMYGAGHVDKSTIEQAIEKTKREIESL